MSALGGAALVAATVGLFGATACAPQPPGGDGQTTTTTTGSPTDGTETSGTSATTSATETETETETSTMGETETGIDFVPFEDVVFYGAACDPYWQDCPEGEKCVPYASTGEGFDATKCVPVLGEGMPGDSCIYDGEVLATDDCGPTSQCFQVVEVDGVQQGKCTAFCQGTPDDPECPETTACYHAFFGSLALCLEQCDPLVQDCPPGQLCSWTGADFGCVAEQPGTPTTGEPCTQLPVIDSCVLGTICLAADVLPSCEGAACCTEYCDVSDPDPSCSDLALACVPFFEEPAPPGWELVGVCIEPPP